MLCVAGVVLGQAEAADGTNAGTATLPVTVGEEIVVAADGPGKECRGAPAVAFGGGAYLCVWREGWEGKNGGARIRAARVGLDGKTLDAAPLELAPNPDRDAPQERPRVAFCPATDKGTFLVVWHDLRNGRDYDVLGARVSAAGKLLDAEPIRIATGPHSQALPDVAADKDGFLVVWQGYDASNRVYNGYAARVAPDGKVGEAVGIGLAPNLRVAWDGEHFLVGCANAGFWSVGDVRRLDAQGRPLEKEKPFRAAVRVNLYSLTGAPGKGWLLVAHRNTPSPWGWGGPGAMRCYFALSEGKMDTSLPKESDNPGNALEPNWIDYTTKDREIWPYGQSAGAWDGKQLVVVWQRYHCRGEKKSMLVNGDIALMRVDGAKRQSDTPVLVAATDAEEINPVLASDGAGNLLCAYEKEVGSKTAICARVIKSK
jgi:hypothetical protein